MLGVQGMSVLGISLNLLAKGFYLVLGVQGLVVTGSSFNLLA